MRLDTHAQLVQTRLICCNVQKWTMDICPLDISDNLKKHSVKCLLQSLHYEPLNQIIYGKNDLFIFEQLRKCMVSRNMVQFSSFLQHSTYQVPMHIYMSVLFRFLVVFFAMSYTSLYRYMSVAGMAMQGCM